MVSRSLWLWALALLTSLVGASSARAGDAGCCCGGEPAVAEHASCESDHADTSAPSRGCPSGAGMGCPCRATPRTPEPLDRAPRPAPRPDTGTWSWAPIWADPVPNLAATATPAPAFRRWLGAPPRAVLSVWVV